MIVDPMAGTGTTGTTIGVAQGAGLLGDEDDPILVLRLVPLPPNRGRDIGRSHGPGPGLAPSPKTGHRCGLVPSPRRGTTGLIPDLFKGPVPLHSNKTREEMVPLRSGLTRILHCRAITGSIRWKRKKPRSSPHLPTRIAHQLLEKVTSWSEKWNCKHF